MGTDSHASKCHYRNYIEVHAVIQLFDNSVLKMQSEMDNPEKLATYDTQDEEKQNKNTTRYMLDTTIPNQANSLNKTWALLKITVIYLIHNLASYKELHRESTLYMIQLIDTWLFQHQPDIPSSIHLYSTASYMEVSEWYRGWYGKSLVLICNHVDKSLYFNHICSNQIF